jgi:nucleoside-diphosphate-sugar epimerase
MAENTALVTGGAGFIGSNLVEYLLNKGFNVRVLDNLSTGKISNIKEFLSDIEFLEGDICDRNLVNKAVEGMDYVFHQAALPSVPRSIEDPYTTNKVNVEGTLNLLLASRDLGVKRFIYASSSSVYGNTGDLPKSEDMPVFPQSPYALSKYAGERYCQIFNEIYGLETVCLRYFNVFGPRQDFESQYAAVIPKFIYQILNGGPITIYGDGLQSRDFTYVTNVVIANYKAAITPGIGGEIFNIACGNRTTINELAKLVMSETGKYVEIVYFRERKGEIKHSQASIEKVKRLLNYQIIYTLSDGIKLLLKHLNVF